MFAALESIFHRWHRRFSRSEWAIRHLGLTPSENTSEVPGLLLIQIDGFAREQLERAIARGYMPFLKRLLKRNHYQLHTFYPGLPTTTPAVQAELYYGVRAAVPAFSFFDRTNQRVVRMYSPDNAKEFEAECAAQAEGLLRGGSSWSNIYTGGAGQEESHFCIASNGLGDMWRTGKIRNIFVFTLLQLPAALRILRLLILESGIGLWNAFRGIFRGENPLLEFGMVLSRVFIGVGARELITIGGKVDVTRGLPIVHLNFVGYDEHSHRRGPGSLFAFWSLRGIDRAIKGLWRAAQSSKRRDYRVWIFSDHGQERTRSFATERPGEIERVVGNFLGVAAKKPSSPSRPAAAPSPWRAHGLRRSRNGAARRLAAADAEALNDPFVLTAMGPVGHLYFREPLSDGQRRTLAQSLVTDAHVPGVLLRDKVGVIRWFHARGETLVPGEVAALLPHPPEIRTEIARDLVQLCENVNAGDLVLLGWSAWDKPWTFAPEHGAHGGPGPQETAGFALLPARTRLPAGTEHFIRPSALRAAALHLLQRAPFAATPRTAMTEPRLRLMTYNTHGCSGTDGRVSPLRIARAIGEQRPDIVALQELDLGRRRSRAEDQAAIIAAELGMHAVFCPTITRDEEHYGHALLSFWPIEVVNRSRLPGHAKGWFKEPRSAIWARVQVAGQRVNVITTHLGLGVHERLLQMQMLMGPDWIGAIPEAEPVILCGDFNCLPRSAPYNLAARRLRDVQHGRRSLPTFSSLRPLVRLDHIFLSPQVETLGFAVPRNDLTRVASDHLPLLADLQIVTATGATSTTTPRPPTAHKARTPQSVSA